MQRKEPTGQARAIILDEDETSKGYLATLASWMPFRSKVVDVEKKNDDASERKSEVKNVDDKDGNSELQQLLQEELPKERRYQKKKKVSTSVTLDMLRNVIIQIFDTKNDNTPPAKFWAQQLKWTTGGSQVVNRVGKRLSPYVPDGVYDYIVEIDRHPKTKVPELIAGLQQKAEQACARKNAFSCLFKKPIKPLGRSTATHQLHHILVKLDAKDQKQIDEVYDELTNWQTAYIPEKSKTNILKM